MFVSLVTSFLNILSIINFIGYYFNVFIIVFIMKCLIMFISLFNIIHFGFFKNVTLDCWERNNLFINVDDLPLLLEQFTICFEKCQQSKNNECFTVASQLNSSIPVLRELYYNGQISYWVCITN